MAVVQVVGVADGWKMKMRGVRWRWYEREPIKRLSTDLIYVVKISLRNKK